MREHRKSERHNIGFQIVYDDGESYHAGYVDDISETGLFLESDEALPPGSIVRLQPASAPAEALFEVAARVIRSEDLDARTDTDGEVHHGLVGIALEFVAVTDTEREGIKTMISHLAKRARTRSESSIRDPLLGVFVDAPSGAAEAAEAEATDGAETDEEPAPDA